MQHGFASVEWQNVFVFVFMSDKKQTSNDKKQLCHCECHIWYTSTHTHTYTKMAHVFGIWCESRADALIIRSMIAQMCINRGAQNMSAYAHIIKTEKKKTNERTSTWMNRAAVHMHTKRYIIIFQKWKILWNKFSVKYHRLERQRVKEFPNKRTHTQRKTCKFACFFFWLASQKT